MPHRATPSRCHWTWFTLKKEIGNFENGVVKWSHPWQCWVDWFPVASVGSQDASNSLLVGLKWNDREIGGLVLFVASTYWTFAFLGMGWSKWGFYNLNEPLCVALDEWGDAAAADRNISSSWFLLVRSPWDVGPMSFEFDLDRWRGGASVADLSWETDQLQQRVDWWPGTRFSLFRTPQDAHRTDATEKSNP